MEHRKTDSFDPIVDTSVVERRLAEERPSPAPGFRSDLERAIEFLSRRLPTREHMRRSALTCLITGVLLLGLAAVSLAGWGPLAA